MATIQPTVNRDVSSLGNVILVTWVLPTNGDVGAPFQLDRYSVSSFSVFGSAVTSLNIRGSNDATAPTNWNSLRDWGGTSMGAISAAGIYTPRDLPLHVSPLLTTGASVTVQMALHRQDSSMVG